MTFKSKSQTEDPKHLCKWCFLKSKGNIMETRWPKQWPNDRINRKPDDRKKHGTKYTISIIFTSFICCIFWPAFGCCARQTLVKIVCICLIFFSNKLTVNPEPHYLFTRHRPARRVLCCSIFVAKSCKHFLCS